MGECGQYLGKGVTNFPCSLEREHEGPHMAQELPRTVRERKNWEAEQRHQASGLAEFQGRAQTTAERYTDGATEPPGSDEYVVLDNDPGAPTMAPARVIRSGSVGEALNEAGVPVHVDTEAPATPQGPTRANREHDQPLPERSDRPAIQDLVIADIESRKKIGLERYGTLLQAFNGRDGLRDLYEELLDALIYLKQVREQDEEVAKLVREIKDLLDPPRPFQATPTVTDDIRDNAVDLLIDLLALLGE